MNLILIDQVVYQVLFSMTRQASVIHDELYNILRRKPYIMSIVIVKFPLYQLRENEKLFYAKP